MTDIPKDVDFSGAIIVISAGGTGGHIYPALATAEALRDANAVVYWVGTPHGPEGDIARENGFTFFAIDIKGLRGNGIKRMLGAPIKIISAISESKRIIKQAANNASQDTIPSAFLGFGGFVTGPAGVAARLSGIPILIHEQNAIPGLTNKLLSRIARETLVAFPTQVWPHAKTVGNPIRKNISKVQKVARQGRPARLTVIGGSLGAKPINDIIPQVATALNDVSIFHQTGKNHYEETIKRYKAVVQDIDIDVEIVPYVDNMSERYANTDLLIARAGALTVSEAASAGIPAIFIPLPHAVDNHQYFNAKFSADNKAAIIIEQSELTAERLADAIRNMTREDKLVPMAINAKKMSHEHALNHVLDSLYRVVSNSQKKNYENNNRSKQLL